MARSRLIYAVIWAFCALWVLERCLYTRSLLCGDPVRPTWPSGIDLREMKDLFDDHGSDDLATVLEAWERVLHRISNDIPAAWFSRFLRPLKPTGIDSGEITIAAPGRFVLDWVKERFSDRIEQYLTDEMGRPVSVALVAVPRAKPEEAVATVRPVSLAPTGVESFAPNPKYTFESFVEGQSNRMAVAGARNAALNPGLAFNPLFIYGPSGLGKTHLLHAVAHAIRESRPKATVMYVSAQQFAQDYVDAIQNKRMEAFRRQLRGIEVWLLDDIQFISGKDKTQEELFHIYNSLYMVGRQIVITADRSPRDLNMIDERLSSRFEAGLVADVQMPDFETRCAILRKKAEQLAVSVPAEAADYLAEHVPGNIRILEGALTRLVATGSISHRAIDVAMAEDLVEKYYRRSLERPSTQAIIEVVSRHYKIPVHEIKGSSRNKPIVEARHVAVYLIREVLGSSWKHIGSQLGDRDHTSIMHAHKKVAQEMQDNRDKLSTVQMLGRSVDPHFGNQAN